MIVATERPSIAPDPASVRPGRSPLELFAAAIALLVPIAVVTGLGADAWVVRSAILLVVAGVGLPVLVSQTRGTQPFAARAAAAFLVVGTASAVVSRNHTTAVFGLYYQGTGLLFMMGLAGAWAIGRSIRPEARSLIESAFLLAIFINVGIALFAAVVDISAIIPNLADAYGRASGLAGNPVYLASLAVFGLALLVPRFVAAPARWAVPVGATAAAIQLSGTRGALIVLAGIALWAGRRHGLRVAARLALLLVLGLGVGTALGASSGATATARAGGGGMLARPTTWLSAGHSVVHHPLLGVGPGQFRTATSPYRPASVALSEGPDRLFTDAHNLLVEYATTTGLLGAAALFVWLVSAVRSARGWLLVGALAILAMHLFEPQQVVTTPLAFLALGASGSLGVGRSPRRQAAIRWVLPACCVGVAMAAASLFLFGEFQVNQGQLDLRAGPAQQGNRLLPAWPRTASLLARVWLFHGITNGHDEADNQRSRSWRLAAVQRDNTDPGLWNDLAEFDESRGQRQQAQTEYLSALRFNPTSARAMGGLARLAHARCDPDQERYWRQRSLKIAPSPPPPAAGSQTVLPGCALQP